MKIIITLLLLFVFHQSDAIANFDNCKNKLFRYLEKGLVVTGPLKALLEPLYERDPRLQFLKLAKQSEQIGILDDLTSTATQRFIFSDKINGNTDLAKDISTNLKSPNVLLKTVNATEKTQELIKNIEQRFHAATAVINRAYELKHGKSLITDEKYIAELLSFAESTFKELSINNSEFIPILEQISKFKNSPELWNEKDLLAAGLGADLTMIKENNFDKDFLAQIPVEGTLGSMMPLLATHLNKRLEEMPVGLSYATPLRTMTVMYGNRHYSGSWFIRTSLSDKAMNKIGTSVPTVKIEINTTYEKKKRLAINLDRLEGELDILFRDENQRSCNFQVCGTFATTMFMKSGIPVFSGAYSVPEITMLSLSLQRMLRSPYIKKVTSTIGAQPFKIPIIVVTSGHLGFAALEMGFWYFVISKTVGAVSTLIGTVQNDDTNTACEVHQDSNGTVTVENCQKFDSKK